MVTCLPSRLELPHTTLCTDQSTAGPHSENEMIRNEQLERAKAEGDLFSGVLAKGIDLNDVLQRLAALT